MFKNVAIGIIAVSTIGFQVWIGAQYKKFLGELLEKEEASEPEDSLHDTYEALKDLEKILDELI